MASRSELPELPDLSKLPHIVQEIDGAAAYSPAAARETAREMLVTLVAMNGLSPAAAVVVLLHFAAACEPPIPYDDLDRIVLGVLGKGIELAGDDFLPRDMLGAVFGSTLGAQDENQAPTRAAPPAVAKPAALACDLEELLVAIARAHHHLCDLDTSRPGRGSFGINLDFSFGTGAAHVRQREWTVKASIEALGQSFETSGDQDSVREAGMILGRLLLDKSSEIRARANLAAREAERRQRVIVDILAPYRPTPDEG